MKSVSASEPVRRIRRASAEEQAELRQQVLVAAFEIFGREGLHGLTMRAVASAVGVSAMALYRYFADKAELVQGLWDFVMDDVHRRMAEAVEAAGPDPRARMRACTESAIAYWETHPDHFRLVFMTEEPHLPRKAPKAVALSSYQRVIDLPLEVLQAWADELGVDRARALAARDLRAAMVIGYLHARLVNRRYPWNDIDALRGQVVDTIVRAAEDGLRGPAR
ncbi:TetR/AcrR family transcriptional regulator [Ideonella sp. YS5]|uniref:TetR/AcrR family transcriptional regulator n=1 Tax=Ideonella sp. YS5 TaxID=3453714 RepID=UPI003EEDBF55